jgi:hypothetical protein
MTVIDRFENVEVQLVELLLYAVVNVLLPAVRLVSTVVVLACMSPVLVLEPAPRSTAHESLAAWSAPPGPSTEKLIQARQLPPNSGETRPVTITIARVPVVAVTDGLLVSVV